MTGSGAVRVARVYDPRGADDGARVLVDRLWPRGLSKHDADLDDWCREIAPSTELRKWYGHEPTRFEEFSRRYRAELDAPEQRAALTDLRARMAADGLTLLTATKTLDLSQAAVLAGILTAEADAHD